MMGFLLFSDYGIINNNMAKKAQQTFGSSGDFLDYLNAEYGTKDTDHDGITDEVEKMIGTDPYKFDTDNDGVGDGDELRQGRNPLGAGSFKDFFLPHEGNNWQPTALHPHRVMLYATSAIIVKILVVIFVLGLPMSAWTSPDVLRSYSTEIIKLTNQIRKEVGVGLLTENIKLSQAAYAKAEDMLTQEYFSHNGPDGQTLANWLAKYKYAYTVAGENLAVGFNNPSEVMAAWEKSKTHYANIVDADYSQIGVGVVSGEFEGTEQLLAAQFFGLPDKVVKPATTIKKSKTVKVKGVAISRQPSSVTKVNNKPVQPDIKLINDVNLPDKIFFLSEKSFLDYRLAGTKSILRAEVYLKGDIQNAAVMFDNQLISLTQDQTDKQKWFGQSSFDKNKVTAEDFIAPATVIVADNQGNNNLYDLKVNDKSLKKVSALSEYFLAKKNAHGLVGSIFDISGAYYRLLLFINVLVLLFIFVIGWNRTHRKTLAASVLSCLLFMLLLII